MSGLAQGSIMLSSNIIFSFKVTYFRIQDPPDVTSPGTGL